MSVHKRVTILLLFLAAFPGFSPGPGRADAAAPQGSGMFRGAEPDSGPVFDARMTARSIRFARLEGHGVIEGDIDLGTPDTRAKVSITQAVRFARQARNDPAIFGPLGKEAKNRVNEFADINVNAITFQNDDERDNRVNDALAVLDLLAPKDADQEVQAHANYILNTSTADYRWPGGVIPFEVAPGFPHRNRIDEAIRRWHQHTDHIRLVELNPQNRANFKNWVRFIQAPGCYSTVGRLPIPGPQDIGLDAGCGVPQVIHEIGHAVGLFHEQSRNDRERYIEQLRTVTLTPRASSPLANSRTRCADEPSTR